MNHRSDEKPQVFIVDDDQAVRAHMRIIAESAGFRVQCFDSPQSFLDTYTDTPGCLISDFLMPEMSGLELQSQLEALQYSIPVILMSAFGDVATVKKAFKSGAVDFLQKPIAPDEFIAAIREALEKDRATRISLQRKQSLNSILHKLTAREHQILAMLLTGKTNKHIARELSLSTRTVEAHRAKIMRKMNSSSFQELICRVSNL